MVECDAEDDFLILRISDPLLPFHLFNDLSWIHANGEPVVGHLIYSLGGICFRLINIRKIASCNITDRFHNDLTVILQAGKTLFASVQFQ